MNTNHDPHTSSPGPVEFAAAQAKFQLLTMLTKDTFYKMSVDWGIMYNLNSFEFLEETLASNKDWFKQYIPPFEQAKVTAAINEAIHKKSIFELEHQVYQADGGVGWVISRAIPLIDEDGQIESWIGIARDITKHKHTEETQARLRDVVEATKQAERALRQIQFRQRAILESAKDYAILTLDIERRVTSWNAGAESMIGYSEDEIMGQLGDVFFVPEDRAEGAPEAEAERALRLGRAENERWHMRKDGLRFYGSGVSTALLDEAGNVMGILKVMRNLTAQKQAEEALLEADRRKDEFLALLAHELRNPMATLSNTLMLLELSDGKEEILPLETALPMMRREMGQLVRLVDDLLDVSRINQGKILLKLERLDLTKLVEEALEAIRPLIDHAQRELVATLPDDPIFLEGDATRLTQVIRNLLTNASKFSHEGGHIWLTLAREDDGAVLRVKDDGIGIPPDQLERIFGLFTQVDASRTRSQGGLGLGLTLVKEFIGKHNGEIEASSAGLGKGSEFIIRLPLQINS
ncbi:ATP-binding protein [Dyadobacter sp. CY326]|uniref:ATP-binding protein n=1 Tax=Dyadobacter sp. CY326 TaxID=2907300 RepID=UPI001F2E1E59|nr:ATP-binding protein [Dyadobacter sp. CY326]MCE7065041.1 ATP-binding protein [Dyadobacter sp. CY326]